jgi:hypothetical protein
VIAAGVWAETAEVGRNRIKVRRIRARRIRPHLLFVTSESNMKAGAGQHCVDKILDFP